MFECSLQLHQLGPKFQNRADFDIRESLSGQTFHVDDNSANINISSEAQILLWGNSFCYLIFRANIFHNWDNTASENLVFCLLGL